MTSRAGKVHLKSTPEELRAAGALLDDAVAKTPLDFPTLFGNRHPVELEIGPGKGSFLLRRAAARPEINFLGVEWARQYALYVADRAVRAGLVNVRTLCADAEAFIRQVPDQSLLRIHIYFPDPWPKRRHLRRRLLKPAFLRQAKRCLRIGGWLGMVTDHEDYARQIRSALSVIEGMAKISFFTPTGGEGAVVGTNFENKYAADGKRFHAFAALRYR
jgi:tRNA (guanine-N7-)-methyltransferase